VHALENPSADIPIIGPVTNILITANKNDNAARPISAIFRFAIVLSFIFLAGKTRIAQCENKTL